MLRYLVNSLPILNSLENCPWDYVFDSAMNWIEFRTQVFEGFSMSHLLVRTMLPRMSFNGTVLAYMRYECSRGELVSWLKH